MQINPRRAERGSEPDGERAEYIRIRNMEILPLRCRMKISEGRVTRSARLRSPATRISRRTHVSRNIRRFMVRQGEEGRREEAEAVVSRRLGLSADYLPVPSALTTQPAAVSASLRPPSSLTSPARSRVELVNLRG